MITLNGVLITPTIFPDKTAQIWQLPQEIDDTIFKTKKAIINWEYEGDHEIFQLLQILDLLKSIRIMDDCFVALQVETLPYARQDKRIDNDTTFALSTLCNTLLSKFDIVKTLDVHNPNASCFKEYEVNLVNILPNEFIDIAIKGCFPDIICFPDAGAAKRGYDIQGLPYFHLDKKRNQETGEIEGLECKLPLNLDGKCILIVDDLCDGGRTFIEAAKLLRVEHDADTISLYVTHGIFSKGTKILFDSGINQIYTSKGSVGLLEK